MSALRTLCRSLTSYAPAVTSRVPQLLVHRCKATRANKDLHLPTPAGPLATWPSLKPRPEKAVGIDAQADPAEVNPLRHPDFFSVRNLFTMEDLFSARVHLGHKVGSLNPYMAQHLLGERLGVCVFDLDQTSRLLREALNFTAHIAFRGGIIMFVCRQSQHVHLVEQAASACGEYSHCRHWPLGVFTDSTGQFGGVTRLPDLLVFISTMGTVLEQHRAVSDAAKMLIPSVGIVDSNADPRLVTYPVPGNDDTGDAVRLYCKLFSEAVKRGKAARQKA